jgi:hypothetical protein
MNKFNITNIEDINTCINELKAIDFNVNNQGNGDFTVARVERGNIRGNLNISSVRGIGNINTIKDFKNIDRQELEANLESIKHSMSTLNTIDRLRYAAIPATAVAAILGPVAFASVAGLSAVTLGIGSWKANKERNNLLSQIDRLKKSDANNTVGISDDFISKVNSIAVGGSSL